MVLKNKKLLWILLVISGVAFFIIGQIYVSSKEETLDKKNDIKVEKNDIDKSPTSKAIDQEQIVQNKVNHLHSKSEINQIEDMFTDSVFLNIVSLSKAPLSTEKKIDLASKIQNLYRYGSFSGGKITHEFSNIEKYREFLKKYGYEAIEKKISFSPKEIPLNNKSLELTGSYYSGGYTENEGFDSLYRLYEAPNGEKVEINQMKLDENGMKLLIIEETLNYRVNNTPATLESFNSDMTYNIRFVHDGYRYTISTKNLDKNYIIDLANSLTQ